MQNSSKSLHLFLCELCFSSRPVRVNVGMKDDMKIGGKRPAIRADYKVYPQLTSNTFFHFLTVRI